MKEYLDATSLATRVMMLRQTTSKSVLLVEGLTDNRFYQKFIQQEKCEIQICGNKTLVLDTIAILDARAVNGVLGLVDLDYDELLGQSVGSRNLIRTHVHDLEVMLVESPALEAVLTEYADPQKLDAFQQRSRRTLRDTVFDAAFSIGLVRYYCQINSIPGDFKGTNLTDCIDDDLNVDVTCVVKAIFTSDPFRWKPVINYINRKADELYNRRFHVCQGHDVVFILLKGLSILGGFNSRRLNEGALQGALRLATSLSWFVHTELYSQVKQWECKNPSFKVFRDQEVG